METYKNTTVNLHNALIFGMFGYFQGDAKRIQHFLKVYEFAKLIGELEQLDEKTQQILETAAIVHDIGIRPAEEKYGRCDGKLQEAEGPLPAMELLLKLGFDKDLIARVCYLIAHHHTYDAINGMDYQILVEADFLVNLYEDHCDTPAIARAYETIFKTASGKTLCRTLYSF